MKRFFDLALVLGSLPFCLPVLLFVASLVRFRMGKPILFQQARAGLDGKPFELVKFRTMNESRDNDGDLLPDAKRLSPFGRWLRATSLDELPELWNVLKGDMSLVGPRPLPVRYLERYSDHQRRRHESRPGLTGWAQINGRNALDWPRRFQLDVWYVDNQSFSLDVRILLRSLGLVLSGRGVSEANQVTCSEFFGERCVFEKGEE